MIDVLSFFLNVSGKCRLLQSCLAINLWLDERVLQRGSVS